LQDLSSTLVMILDNMGR
jgi:hypothetical protein